MNATTQQPATWTATANAYGDAWRLEVDAGVTDPKGRKLGAIVSIWQHQAWTPERGTYPTGKLAVRCHAARDGRTFGALQNEQVVDTLEQAKALGEQKAAATCARYRKTLGK